MVGRSGALTKFSLRALTKFILGAVTKFSLGAPVVSNPPFVCKRYILLS